MPIFIAIVRRCQCAICNGVFDLEEAEEPPQKCAICGSREWMWGADNQESRLIRLGLLRRRKALNPGAKSKVRQDRGKKQWRRFKPKDVG